MSKLQDYSPPIALQFYETDQYPCSYLPDRMSRSQVAIPAHLINTDSYGELVRRGFRRSGFFAYRPYCDACGACIPVRVSVNDFKADRTQRRTFRQNESLIAREVPLVFNDEHYQLYLRYQRQRHANGGMDQDDKEQYIQSLLHSSVDTRLIEFRKDAGRRLCMVSIVDCLPDGLSSVYSFFEPDEPRAGYGTYGVLWQVKACQRIERSYLYLGYWIGLSRKMDYKRHFHALEGFVEGKWRVLEEKDFDTLLR